MGPKNVIELGFRSAIAQISDMTMSLGLNRCLDVRSARLYGQFSLDKTLTLQAGSTVFLKWLETEWSIWSKCTKFHKLLMRQCGEGAYRPVIVPEVGPPKIDTISDRHYRAPE